MARLAVGQRQRADRTLVGLAATEWPPVGVEVTPKQSLSSVCQSRVGVSSWRAVRPPLSAATVSETGTGRGRLETVSGWDLSRRAAESADPGAATTAAEWTPPEWQQCANHMEVSGTRTSCHGNAWTGRWVPEKQ